MLSLPRAAAHLASGLTFPPFGVRVLAPPAESGPAAPDLRLELTWEGTDHRFDVAWAATGAPRPVTLALAAALQRRTAGRHPMVMAPHLAPDALERLLAAGVSALDLSGNGVVVVPGAWLVHRSGARNRFPARAAIRAVYAGTSSLVGRAFLGRPEYRRVKDVRAEILARGGAISLGTVSKVLKTMVADGLVERSGLLRLADRDGLLDALRDGYAPPETTARLEGTLDRRRLRDLAAADDVLHAVHGAPVHSDFPGLDDRFVVYAEDAERAALRAGMDALAAHPNAVVLQTDDPRVYFDRHEEDGVRWTSRLQTWLEADRDGPASLADHLGRVLRGETRH